MDFEWSTKPPFLGIPAKMKLFVYQYELEKIKKEMKTYLRSRNKKVTPQRYWGKVLVYFD